MGRRLPTNECGRLPALLVPMLAATLAASHYNFAIESGKDDLKERTRLASMNGLQTATDLGSVLPPRLRVPHVSCRIGDGLRSAARPLQL